MDNPVKKRVWLFLGGAHINPYLYLFHTRQGRVKLAFLLAYYTIKAGTEFRGRVLQKPYVLQPGWIVGTRAGTDGAEVWYHARGLYDLTRSFQHAIGSEWRAQSSAEIAVGIAIEVARDLLAFWPLDFQQRADLTRKLAEIEAALEKAQNPSLQEADDAVLGAIGFEDSLGRPNPGATAAKITRARGLVQMRLCEITSIVPNISRLHVVAVQELARIEHLLLERDFETLRFVRRKLPQCRSEQHLRWVASCLRQVRGTCETVRVAPFYNNARYIQAEIGAALNILINTHLEPRARANAIAPIVLTIVRSIAFKRAQRKLENIIRDLSMSISAADGELSASQCMSFVRRVESYARRAMGLNEDSFRHKRLARIRQILLNAAQCLREGGAIRGKVLLKQASALL